MKSLPTLATALFAFALFATPAVAQTIWYDDGELSFAYQQFPSGPYGGMFSASGPLSDPPDLPPGSETAYGTLGEHEGNSILAVIAGVRNADGSVDAAILWIASAEPIEPGSYSIDAASFTVQMGFVDDATGLEFPENPWEFDWSQWPTLVSAEHLLVGVSGSIVVTEMSNGYVAGTFAGILGEPTTGMLVAAHTGEFIIGTSTTGVAPTTWGSVKSAYRAP